MRKIKVRFFGAFRRPFPSGEHEIEAPGAISVRELKDLVAKNLRYLNCPEANSSTTRSWPPKIAFCNWTSRLTAPWSLYCRRSVEAKND